MWWQRFCYMYSHLLVKTMIFTVNMMLILFLSSILWMRWWWSILWKRWFWSILWMRGHEGDHFRNRIVMILLIYIVGMVVITFLIMLQILKVPSLTKLVIITLAYWIMKMFTCRAGSDDPSCLNKDITDYHAQVL